MVNLTFIETGKEGLDVIRPLWEKLNEHHQSKKSDFQGHYENFTFKERKDDLLRKARGGDLHVDLAEHKESGIIVGYSVATISQDKWGEIDSIYVDEEYRSIGIGDSLMKRSMLWLESKGVKKKKVTVAIGNQEALSFYERYGFRPRSIILEQVKSGVY